MRTAKHSSGPWRASERSFSVFTFDGQKKIATIFRNKLYGIPPEEIAANLRMVSCAPEMYSVLIEVSRVLENLKQHETNQRVRSLIRRIEG